MSPPTSMRAIAIPAHGDVDIIQEITVAVPSPGPEDVLIKVSYAGVNFRDTYVRTGLYPEKSFPFILGFEATGTIIGLPTDQSVIQSQAYQSFGLKLGQRVVARANKAFAEYMSASWMMVFPIPDDIPTPIAAASLVQGLTALTFMTESYDVKTGDWVLVHTAAGGFGLMVCQIGRARGAHVIGTTSNKEKAQIAKENGAEHVIIYTEENTVQRVHEITKGMGVIAIYDGVGKDTWESDFQMIARKGTIVSVGNASGAVPPFPPLKLIEKNVKLLRPTVTNYIATAEEVKSYMSELWKLIKDGTVKAKIHKEYPFSAAGVKQAQIDITGRSTTGKLLIKIADE